MFFFLQKNAIFDKIRQNSTKIITIINKKGDFKIWFYLKKCY